MIPDPEQLEEIAQRSGGQIEEIPFAALLQALFLSGRTTLLRIERDKLYKNILIEDGAPADCRSNLVHETLGRFMLAKGLLSESDHKKYVKDSFDQGIRLGETLIENEVISASDLFKILQENLAKKLLDGFGWTDGTFSIEDETPESESPLKVNVPQLVLAGITRYSSQREVNNAISTLVGKSLVLHPEPLISADELKLKGQQRNVLERIQEWEQFDMDELAANCELSLDEFSRLLYALSLLGLVIPADRLRSVLEIKIPSSTLEGTPESSADPLGTDEPPLLTREELMKTYLDHRRFDPFRLLGVPENAHPSVVQRKFLAFARKYAPWNLIGTEMEPLMHRAQRLFLAATAAYAELADTDMREDLTRRRLQAQREFAAKPAPDLEKMDSQLLDPAVEFERARILMEDNQFERAVQYLKKACDYDPQNGLYRAALAYCWFQIDPVNTAQDSISKLKRALRLDPDCGLTHYYLGEVYRRGGSFDEAEEHLRQASKLMPADRRPVDALKEVSIEHREIQQQKDNESSAPRQSLAGWQDR